MIKLKMYLLGLMLVFGGVEGSTGLAHAANRTVKGLSPSSKGGSGGVRLPVESSPLEIRHVIDSMRDLGYHNHGDPSQKFKLILIKQDIYVKLAQHRELAPNFQAYKFNGLVTDQTLRTQLSSKRSSFISSIREKVKHVWVCVNPVADTLLKEQAGEGESAYNYTHYAAVRSVDYDGEKYAILSQTLNRHTTDGVRWGTATWQVYELEQGTDGVSLPLLQTLRTLQKDNKILCVNLPGPDVQKLKEPLYFLAIDFSSWFL